MKLCRFLNERNEARVGIITYDQITEAAGNLSSVLEGNSATASGSRSHSLAKVRLLAPVERQEIWAAGVTYLRSKKARMEESDFSATAYDRVYDAERPELFFKSMPEKVVAPGDAVGIRKDARWNVPEPELALVINSRSQIVGYTIGHDMSSRDIEGENLLYLPQAKVYNRSCAIGPWMVVGPSEGEARHWKIQLEIRRNGQVVFEGETSVSQIK